MYIIYVYCYSTKFKQERTLICFIPGPNNKKTINSKHKTFIKSST